MKVGTVGVLAAACMTLTSLTVWSVTPPLDAEPGAGRLRAAASAVAIDALVPRSEFVAGDLLEVEGRIGHARMMAGEAGETYVFVDVRSGVTAQRSSSPPVNLAIAVDRSGSMKGKRLRNAVDGARGMVRRLRDGDFVTVVSYDTRVRVDVPSTRIDGDSKERVVRALGRIRALGDTCISCGIESAMKMIGRRSGMVSHLLLLSDGEATAGVRRLDGFRAIATRARERGVAISSIGVDVDYNEQVLALLANDSNGRHHFVEDTASLAKVFDRELGALVSTVATDATLTVELAEGIELEKVYDRAFRRDGRRIEIPMGAFTASDKKTALLRVRVDPGAPGARAVASVSLAYDGARGPAADRARGALGTMLTSTSADVSELDALVSARLGRSETAAALEEANELFKQGKDAAADRRIRRRLASVRARGASAANAAPASRLGEVRKSFEFEDQALSAARSDFQRVKKPEPAPKASRASCAPGDLMCAMRAAGAKKSKKRPKLKKSETRAGKRVIRDNAARVNPFKL